MDLKINIDIEMATTISKILEILPLINEAQEYFSKIANASRKPKKLYNNDAYQETPFVYI